MGQNQVILRHQNFTFPRLSGASERANGRASGPVLTPLFLFVPDHSAPDAHLPKSASSSSLRFNYSVDESVDIPESDIGDADTDQLLAPDETRNNNSFWTFEYYQQFFEVVGQNNQKYRLKYWATCLSVCSFACSLGHFAHSRARGTVNDWMAIYSVFFSILDHSVITLQPARE